MKITGGGDETVPSSYSCTNAPWRGILREYVDYYNSERVHTSISDAPIGRAVESQPSEHAKVIGFPRVGGLHHRYTWREAS